MKSSIHNRQILFEDWQRTAPCLRLINTSMVSLLQDVKELQ